MAVLFINTQLLFGILLSCVCCEDFGCKLTPFRNDMTQNGLLWNCSHQNLDYIPAIPTSRNVTAVDISYNNLRRIRKETFTNLTSDVEILRMNNNRIRTIEANAFVGFELKELDISSCELDHASVSSGAFNNLTHLSVLHINNNSFKSYPGDEISKLRSLVNLTIDIFPGFIFGEKFLSLKQLGYIKFVPQGLITLTNSSFQGLRNSPIFYLDLDLFNHVADFCEDLSEELFCSFPYLKGLSVSFGMSCNIKRILRTLKCLQGKDLEYFHSSDNHDVYIEKAVIINDSDVEYLRNICIKELILRNNDIEGINFKLPLGKFQSCLQVLDLSSNNIQFSLNYRLWGTLILFTPNIKVIKICCQNADVSKSRNWGYSTYNDRVYKRRVMRNRRRDPYHILLPQTLEYLDISNAADIRTQETNIVVRAINLKFLNISWTEFDIRYRTRWTSVSLDFPSLIEMDVSYCTLNAKFLSLQKLTSLKVLIARKSDFIAVSSSGYSHSLRENILHFLKNLNQIDISDNDISHLPRNYFVFQRNLSITILMDKNYIKSEVLAALQVLTNINRLYMRHFTNEWEIYYFNFEPLLSLHVSQIYLESDEYGCDCYEKDSLNTLWRMRDTIADLNKMTCRFAFSGKPKTLQELFRDESWRRFRLNCIVNDFLLGFSIILLSTTVILLIPAMIIFRCNIISRCKAINFRDKLRKIRFRFQVLWDERMRRRGYRYYPVHTGETPGTVSTDNELSSNTISQESVGLENKESE
ncbi:uncharacterized protein LOC133195466 [Saccostrea echinata]|uniref:uncharacterized protein LOC133195466 n=1 Tax=Saccostrea echinata TaxID=191078 RepID=UPI002A81B02E|nr:uncharacterized protein LOC133195466 [Saccostrea echinata]